MAGLTSVDGLVSGLDTTSIIKQLMTLERQPQVRLQSQRTAHEKVLGLYQVLATKLTSLATAADAIRTSAGWSASTATSTAPDAVAVTAGASAQPTSLTFKVTALAATHSVVSAATVPNLTDAVVADPGVGLPATLTVAGTAVDVTADRSLSGVVTAINASAAGVVASAVKVSGGYRLQLTAKASGAAGAFTATGFDTNVGSLLVTNQGADATLQIGTTADAFTVSSSTNTFTDLTPGLTVTAKQTTSSFVSVTVGKDATATADKVDAFVKAANDVLTFLKTNSSYNVDTESAGLLLSDPLTRNLGSAIRSAMTSATSGSLSAKSVGVQSSKDGTITFDKAAFLDSYGKDADGIAGFFQLAGGLADATHDVVDGANNATTGTLTTAIATRKERITATTREIDAWDSRLSLRETALRRQFSAMETALGNLRNQSSWLSGQLASLPGFSSE